MFVSIFLGDYDPHKMHHSNMKKFKKYGPIVKEQVTGSDPYILNVFDPNDFEKVFRYESKNPSRRSHIALEYYRMNKRDKYNTGGLLPR